MISINKIMNHQPILNVKTLPVLYYKEFENTKGLCRTTSLPALF